MKIQFKILFLIIGAFWTLFILLSYSYVNNITQELAISNALSHARESFTKDILLFRKFIAYLGGIYVPVSDKIVPNPYLKMPKRDITSNYGDNLTLLNPAYLTRLFHEFATQYEDNREYHLTSLHLINPANKPYDWEIKPLKSFEKGEKEFFEVQTENNKKIFRYMAPVYVEKECLRCHGEGIYKASNRVYKIGDLRGGISVSLDFEPFLSDAKASQQYVKNIYILLGFLGLLGLFLFYKYLERSEINLVNEKEKFKAIFEYSPVGMFFYDNFGNILEVNHKFKEIFGGTEEEKKRINLFKLDNKEFQSKIEKSISEGEGLSLIHI